MPPEMAKALVLVFVLLVLVLLMLAGTGKCTVISDLGEYPKFPTPTAHWEKEWWEF